MGVYEFFDVFEKQGTPAQTLWVIEGMPVVGAVVSVPGIMMSLAMSIYKVAQAAFNAILAAREEPSRNHQILHRMQQARLFEDASDWGIILLNQVVNLCTLGVLNNLIVAKATDCGRARLYSF